MQPTKENIAAYMYMTNFTRVKSLIFSHAVVDYTMENSKYDMSKKSGTTSWSHRAVQLQETDEAKKIIAEHKNNLGIIVFIKYGCPFCEKQLPVLNWLQSDYQIDVIAVSLNRCPENSSGIPCKVNPAAFKAYNIQSEPTIVLVIRQADGTPKFEPVGVGLTDEVTLVNRISYFVKGYYQPETKYDNSNLFKLLEEGQ
jgi:thiol-disulfide isomerase/thioredoxin